MSPGNAHALQRLVVAYVLCDRSLREVAENGAVNALFPQNGEKKEKPNYVLSGWQNEYAPDAPIPLVLGKIRYAPRYAARTYTEVVRRSALYADDLVAWLRAACVEQSVGRPASSSRRTATVSRFWTRQRLRAGRAYRPVAGRCSVSHESRDAGRPLGAHREARRGLCRPCRGEQRLLQEVRRQRRWKLGGGAARPLRGAGSTRHHEPGADLDRDAAPAI